MLNNAERPLLDLFHFQVSAFHHYSAMAGCKLCKSLSYPGFSSPILDYNRDTRWPMKQTP